jgi:hypothetical protein
MRVIIKAVVNANINGAAIALGKKSWFSRIHKSTPDDYFSKLRDLLIKKGSSDLFDLILLFVYRLIVRGIS